MPGVATCRCEGIDMVEQYTCPACGRTFDKIDTDEEVSEESKIMWGDVDPDKLVTVCDECFKSVMAHFGLAFE